MSAGSVTRVRRAAVAAGFALSAMAVGVAAPALAAAPDPSFHRESTYPVYLNNPGDPADETVAEISDVTEDGNTLIYTDAVARQIGFLDITDPAAPQGLGTLSVSELGDAEDEPTSVAVLGEYVLVVVNTSPSFTEPSGRVDIVDIATRTVARSIELPGQPDSIAIAPDGTGAVIAIENERDEDVNDGDLPQDPPGTITFLAGLDGAVDTWTASSVDLTGLDGLDTPSDPEPEYVAYSPDSTRVALTLQENNGIAVFDATTTELLTYFTAGTVSLTGIDTEDDENIDLTGSFEDRPREPDAITWIDDAHVATANEGDWKGGTRTWSVFDADTGEVVFDSGTDLDYLAVEYGQYPDFRDSKGTEPEGIVFAEFGGTPYVFVGSERANFVAVYDVSTPTAPQFEQFLPVTNGPEGLKPIPGRDLLAVSSETDSADDRVRASVTLFSFGPGSPEIPTIHSARVDGVPIPWGTLGALSADPIAASRLVSVSDAAYTPTHIFSIDTAQSPALIDASLTVTREGEPIGLDAEGIYARPQGGFWLAVEGATGPENALVLLDAVGAVQQEIPLPAEVASGLGSQGLEGVTARTVDGVEEVWVVIQREVATDPAGVARIGRYLPAAGTWEWFGYQLETTTTSGDWIGLSEITVVEGNRLAVIERDKLNGPDALVKRIETVEIPAAGTGAVGGAAVSVLPKALALDVLPALGASNGWIQEKLEGLTVGGDGNVYAVTDNDGVSDATGETVFLRLGTSVEVFGAAETDPTTTPTGTSSTVPTTSTPAPTSAATTPAAPTSAVPSRPGLASTGSDATVLTLPGVLLLVIGGAAVALTMRRSRRHH